MTVIYNEFILSKHLLFITSLLLSQQQLCENNKNDKMMGNGAWSFLVARVICLVNSNNERVFVFMFRTIHAADKIDM